MRIGQAMVPEFDAEMANTRRVLAQIPNDKFPWRIHERSNTLGWVANHLADIPAWAAIAINQDAFDIAPPGGEPYALPTETSTDGILTLFDKNVAESRPLLENVDDDVIKQPWKLLSQGAEIMTMPRLAVVRTWVLNHSIHHRACACVYLRVNDLSVPGMYGPSGDETE